MKKLCVIFVFLCFGLIVSAQVSKPNSLEIVLRQTGVSYTTDIRRNDYYPEFKERQFDYKFVHEADSSFMVGEVPFPFKLTHGEPSFNGDEPTEFCKWLGKKIFDLLENGNKYTFKLTIDFVLSSDGSVKEVHIDPYHSDKEQTSLGASILNIVKDSPRWKPEHHYCKSYCTPFSIHISFDHFVKGEGLVIIGQYSDSFFQSLSNQLWLDSPERAQGKAIPDYQIASDKDIDEKAHPEDESVNLSQWVKHNIQDVTEMVGFEDGETEIELIISANGWVSKATVVNTYDSLLGEYLADELLRNCPRWVPAKVNGICVPSKVRFTYSWRF